MVRILERTIFVHGGYNLAKQYRLFKANIKVYGHLLSQKCPDDFLDDVDFTANLVDKKINFLSSKFRAVYTPQKILVQTEIGKPVVELISPRTSFKMDGGEERWSTPQLVYYLGYMLWNYITAPYCFENADFKVTAIGIWKEKRGETWQRLQVNFPDHIPSHSRNQTYYIGKDNLIRRIDYDVDIAGGMPIAQYLEDYTNVYGLKVPTRSNAYRRGDHDLRVQGQPPLVSIDYSNFKLIPK